MLRRFQSDQEGIQKKEILILGHLVRFREMNQTEVSSLYVIFMIFNVITSHMYKGHETLLCLVHFPKFNYFIPVAEKILLLYCQVPMSLLHIVSILFQIVAWSMLIECVKFWSMEFWMDHKVLLWLNKTPKEVHWHMMQTFGWQMSVLLICEEVEHQLTAQGFWDLICSTVKLSHTHMDK